MNTHWWLMYLKRIILSICLERVPAYSVAIGEAADGGAGHLEDHDNEDKSGPIRGQYSGHVICLDQSEASITWRNWTMRRMRPRMVSTWVIFTCQKVKYTVRY